MRAIDISTDNVLKDLRDGSRSIWDLGSAFNVPANHPELRRVVDALLASGTVVASGTNLFTATLEVKP